MKNYDANLHTEISKIPERNVNQELEQEIIVIATNFFKQHEISLEDELNIIVASSKDTLKQAMGYDDKYKYKTGIWENIVYTFENSAAFYHSFTYTKNDSVNKYHYIIINSSLCKHQNFMLSLTHELYHYLKMKNPQVYNRIEKVFDDLPTDIKDNIAACVNLDGYAEDEKKEELIVDVMAYIYCMVKHHNLKYSTSKKSLQQYLRLLNAYIINPNALS